MNGPAQETESVVKNIRMFFDVKLNPEHHHVFVKRTTTAEVNGKTVEVEDTFEIVKTDRNTFLFIDEENYPHEHSSFNLAVIDMLESLTKPPSLVKFLQELGKHGQVNIQTS
mgnify:CR=1 FL=1